MIVILDKQKQKSIELIFVYKSKQDTIKYQ
jgi:hypothetical protein